MQEVLCNEAIGIHVCSECNSLPEIQMNTVDRRGELLRLERVNRNWWNLSPDMDKLHRTALNGLNQKVLAHGRFTH
jgi:hypothetical protein